MAASVAAVRDALIGAVIPAVPVPFAADGGVAAAAQDAYARWMAAQPVGGVAVWAHTGRGLKLDPTSRLQVLETWRATMPDRLIVCGVGVPEDQPLPGSPAARTEAVIAATVAMAQEARRGGADAVLIYPPRALRGLPDEAARTVAYHRAVGAVGLPGLAFDLYPAAGGVPYALDTVATLLEVPGVVGIKVATLDGVMRYQDLAATVAATDGSVLVTGEDRFLGYSLIVGARSALIGLAAVATAVPCALMAAVRGQDWPCAVSLSSALDALARATFCPPMEGYIQRLLWCLAADGVVPPGLTDPWGPALTDDDRDRTLTAFARLGQVTC